MGPAFYWGANPFRPPSGPISLGRAFHNFNGAILPIGETALHLDSNQPNYDALKAFKTSVQVLEYLHFPLWIVKDAAWFAALHVATYKIVFQYVSLLFAIPTISITLYLIVVSRSRFLRLENTLIALWLMANTGWMLSELFELPLTLWSTGCFMIGIVIAPYYTRMLIRNRGALSAGFDTVATREATGKGTD